MSKFSLMMQTIDAARDLAQLGIELFPKGSTYRLKRRRYGAFRKETPCTLRIEDCGGGGYHKVCWRSCFSTHPCLLRGRLISNSMPTRTGKWSSVIRAINKYYVSAEIAKRVDGRLRQRLKR